MVTNPYDEYTQRINKVLEDPALQVHEKLIKLCGIASEYKFVGATDIPDNYQNKPNE